MSTLFETVYEVHASPGVRLRLTELTSDERAPVAGGPVFFFVHGFAQNRWAFQRGELPTRFVAKGARVLLAELRGRASMWSTAEARRWTLGTHLHEDLPALLDEAARVTGAERIHYVGHSMGGILGYGLLVSRPTALASLLTLGAPVDIGQHRPLLRLASTVASQIPGSVADRLREVPMDSLLRAASAMAARPTRRGLVRGRIRETVRLANPETSAPEHIRLLLHNADPESVHVLLGLARMARRGKSMLEGIDLVEAVQRASIPIAAVVGTRDVFCTRRCVEPILGGDGPRRILELPEHGHVDLTIGKSAAEWADPLFDFLIGA